MSPAMRTFLWIAALASALVAGRRLAESFRDDELYKKDFVQEYVFAQAVRSGDEPYRPMPEMAARHFDPPREVNWQHPAPHTPVTAILSVPLAALPYPAAATFWLVLELVLLAAIWAMLFRFWGDPVPWPTRVLLYLLSLSLGPVIQELWFGNLSMILAALIVAAWLLLRSGRDAVGGLCLGLAIAIKLTGWPIALWLVWKRRGTAVVVAGIVLLGLNGAAIAVMGSEAVLDYYRRVGPSIAESYRQHDGNYSLWTIGPRLFLEFDSVYGHFVARAPMTAEALGRFLKLALPVAGVIVSLLLAIRCRDFDSSFGILTLASLPVNPVAWDHSLLIAAAPIAILIRRLYRLGWPRLETSVAAASFALAMFPQQAYMRTLTSLVATEEGGTPFLPFAIGLVTYVPLIAIVGGIWLLWTTDDRQSSPAA